MTISRSKQKSRTKSKTPETSLQIPEETKNQGSGLGSGKPELPPAVPSPAVGCCIWRRSQRKSGNNSQKPPKSPKHVQEETPRLNFDRRSGVENQVTRPKLDRDQAEFLDKSENQPIRHDAFHYFGVPLQSSKDNYTFLRQPSQPRFSQDEVRNVGNRSPPYLSATLPSPNKPGKPAAPDQPRAVVLATSKGGKRKNSGADVTDLRHRQRPNSEVLSSRVDFVDGNANKIERKSKRSSTASPSKEHPQSTPKFTLCPTTACCSRQSDTHSVDKNAPRTRSESLGAGQRRKSKVNPLMGRVTVTLERRDGTQLGLGIAGGTDRQIPPTISYLRPGFIAHRCDQLQVGERLLSVNGISLHTLSHTQIMAVLRNSGPTVTLEVEYDLNGPSFQRPPPATTLQRCAEIVLEEDAPETNGQNSTEQGLFGVTLRGGAYGPDPTKSRPLTVTSIRMGSSAHREGRLRIGDRILAISGLDVSNRTLATAQNLLRGDIVQFPSQKGSPRSKVTHLTVEYDVSVLATLRKARGPLLLEVEKVPGIDFGLVLAIKKPKMNTIRHGSGQTGKVAPMQQKIRSIFVQGIVRASVADRCGAIHVGDELLAVDGISLELTGSLAEVYQLLRSQCPILRLELLPSNQVAPSSPLICEGSPVIPRHHSPAFLSHNTGYRSAGQASASGSDQRDGRAVARKVIRPNTVLHKRVDSNTSTSSCSPPDVKERNRKFPFPAPQDRHNAAMGNSVSNLDSNPRKSRNGLSTSRSPPRRAKPKAAVPQMSTSLYNGNIGSVSERPFENKFPLSTSVSGSISARLVPTTIGSSLSHLSSNGIPMGQVCHAETMEVVLYKGSDRDELAGSVVGHLGRTTNSSCTCFGITLDRVPSPGDSADNFGDESHPNIGPVFISAIQKDSPADKSGVLQVGDRVISINDWFTANGTLEEAIHVLSHCQCVGGINASVSLLVEFDVIESVLPPSGLFMVKLAKRGNNLGIVCKSETNNEKGEPVVISDIRTGSVAHRCGSIQLGDRIHSIDGISLESCTVEESMRLLQRSGNVVKLCILKGNADDQDQDSQANNFITFAIELSRKSQPLGITIASTPGPNNPVIISQLAPGGLAERTGAMRVGDRILSINGEILEGKKGVAQAINILQQSTDVVSIKLCRNITAETSPVLPNFGWRCSSSGLMNPGMIGIPLSTIPSDSVSDGSEKIETPLKSVDSAVESLELEDSSDGVHTKSKCGQHFQHNATRPSTSHCYYHPDVISGGSSEHWDSGLSSAADSHTATQPTSSGMGNGPGSNGDRCCSCSQGTPKSNPTTNSNSPGGASDGMSKKSEEDWMRILEALETVGEEEMLKKLEESIMSYGKALSNTPSKVQPQIPTRREDPPRSLHFPPLQSSRETNPGVFSRSIQQNHLATHSGDPYSRQLSSPISTSNSNYYTSIAQPSTSSGILDQSTSSIIYKSQQSNSGTDRSGTDPATPVPPHRTMIGRSLAEHMNGQSSNYAPIQPRLTNSHIQHANPGFSVIGEQIGSVYPLPSSHRSISNGSFYEERKSGHSTLESGTGTANSLPPAMPSPKPKPIGGLELFPGSSHFNTPKSPLLCASRAHSNESPIPYITSPVPGASKDPRNATLRGEVNIAETPGSSGEIISVSLGKDPRTRSFGFSVSDGDAENPGIFVNSVIPGSPADGVVCPMDKVLQINQTSIQFLDCDLAVPLLSTDRVDLLLLRKPLASARSNVNRNIALQPKMTHPRGPCLQSPL